MADLTFEQVQPLLKQIIDQMPSTELERLRIWLNASGSVESSHQEPDSPTWGEQLVALVKSFDLDTTGQEWDNEDPETWVRKQRQAKTAGRNPGWGDE